MYYADPCPLIVTASAMFLAWQVILVSRAYSLAALLRTKLIKRLHMHVGMHKQV